MERAKETFGRRGRAEMVGCEPFGTVAFVQNCSGLQAGIQSEAFLCDIVVISRCLCRIEYQVPAVWGHGTGYQDETVVRQKLIPVLLLVSVRGARMQPVGVWKLVFIHGHE